MTLEDLASLGEIVGAVAVVVTLVYLSFQVRQNTRAVRTDFYTKATQQLWETANTIAQNAELNRLVYKGTAAMDGVSEEDRFRLQLILGSFLFGTEFLLRLYESGQIEKDDWENVFENNLIWLRQPGIIQLMKGRPGRVSKRLTSLVEEAAARQESG
jgi:hypothetical protein